MEILKVRLESGKVVEVGRSFELRCGRFYLVTKLEPLDDMVFTGWSFVSSEEIHNLEVGDEIKFSGDTQELKVCDISEEGVTLCGWGYETFDYSEIKPFILVNAN